jgi:hypothetical protein
LIITGVAAKKKESWELLPLSIDAAVQVGFLFGGGHGFLELVNGIRTGFKTFLAVTAGKGKNDVDIADFQFAYPVAHGQIIDGKFLSDLFCQFFQAELSLPVAIAVFHRADGLLVRGIADKPDIGDHTAAIEASSLADHLIGLDRGSYYLNKHAYLSIWFFINLVKKAGHISDRL